MSQCHMNSHKPKRYFTKYIWNSCNYLCDMSLHFEWNISETMRCDFQPYCTESARLR